MRRAVLFLIGFVFSCYVSAQTIVGTIVDEQKQQVIGASVILQTPDSVFVDACVTNMDGRFSFDKKLDNYRLIIQHLSYKTKLLSVTNSVLPSPIMLEESSENLKEVVVKATRPIVKVNDRGGLVYNTKQLIANRPLPHFWNRCTHWNPHKTAWPAASTRIWATIIITRIIPARACTCTGLPLRKQKTIHFLSLTSMV